MAGAYTAEQKRCIEKVQARVYATAQAALTYVGAMKIEAAKNGVPVEEGDWTQAGVAEMCFDIALAFEDEAEKRFIEP